MASAKAQTTISGRVTDAETGEGVIGAAVQTADRTAGILTDMEGNFALRYAGNFPVELIIYTLGYDSARVEVANANLPLAIQLTPGGITTEVITVVGQAISEQQQVDPRTVERMDAIAVRQTPSADFYEALGNMRGVDITSAAMGFKIINTRGFNSTTPVRSLQLIDGYDNASPGLNFSMGNLVGVSELDVNSVDIIQGAGSVTYGPGAFNGVIAMTTRDPFIHPGLSVQLKVGERQLLDGAFRYAYVVRNKHGRDRLAFKLNASSMSALDWEATNADPTPQSLRGPDNPGGYDAVNRYGDENISTLFNNYSHPSSRRNFPGLDVYYRTGYWERDIVDYNTRSIKLNGNVFYRFADSLTLGYGYNFGTGTTVFQGDNRYSLRDLTFQQHRLELRGRKFNVQAYYTAEDAGKSYDAVFTALLLQNLQKDQASWNINYQSSYSRLVNSVLRNLPGYDNTPPDALEAFLAANQDVVRWMHNEARRFADSQVSVGPGVPTGGEAYLQPGTPEFERQFNAIVSNPSFNAGGARFVSRSRMAHIQGDHVFTPTWATIRTGGRFRYYLPASDGTVFSDTLIFNEDSSSFTRNDISIYEAGAHLLVERNFSQDRILLSAGTRVDKQQNFDAVVSPAFSAVFKVKQRHFLRVNITSAVRNPTLADQFLYYNVGRARLLGNLAGVDSVVDLDNYLNIIGRADTNPILALQQASFRINPIRPEVARTLEFGYRGNPWDPFFIDLSAWYSIFDNFIGFNLVNRAPSIEAETLGPLNPIRKAANAQQTVTTFGLAVGLNYYFAKFYSLTGNFTWTELAAEETDPIIPAYNTPRYKFNIGIGGRDMSYDINLGQRALRLRGLGFAANLRWVEGFLFEGSPQFTGFVETYWTLDAQISWRKPEWWNTNFKLGASNLLNRQVIQVYGGPTIGRLAYFQVGMDLR